MIDYFNIEKLVIESKLNVICGLFYCNTLIRLSCPIKEMKSDSVMV